ncbi:flagellar biosynthetic protein FliO [Pseudalkalibacillus caeni]|uniref:Flagellar protein n=1 Tax=Exobacillus caeni TaxID=2574798 RepID=A0A5R9EZB3_9BACL|nr:flagellar biosynthetic protein FliO [Pseudalkalibacillus caeni]TLS36642.1 hypothetical protein FCL54_14060 [Pseudalkalibacillus caeni]
MQQLVKRILLASLLLFLLGGPHPVGAEGKSAKDWAENNNNQTVEKQNPSDTEQYQTGEGKKSAAILLIKLLFYTVLVIVLIYALIKFLAIRQRKMQHHSVFKTMGGTPLGNNRSVQMIKVGGSVFLLGVGDQVSLLKEITDPEEVSKLEAEADNQPTDKITRGIKDFLKQRQNTEQASLSSFQGLFKESLASQRKRRAELDQKLAERKDGDQHD